MKRKVKKIIFNFAVLVFLFSFYTLAFANSAELELNPTKDCYEVGDLIKIKVLVASDVELNAVAAKISFPKNLLTYNSFSGTESMIDFWAAEPAYLNEEGALNFEGVVLNGFKQKSGTILSLFFKAKAPGVANLKFERNLVLANDGKGTVIPSSAREVTLTIAENNKIIPMKEEIAPENENLEPKSSCGEVAEPLVVENKPVQKNNFCKIILTSLLVVLLFMLAVILYVYNRILKHKKILKNELAELEEIKKENLEK